MLWVTGFCDYCVMQWWYFDMVRALIGSNFRDMKTGPRCGANERHIFLISKRNMRGFFWPGEWDRVARHVFHVTKIRAISFLTLRWTMERFYQSRDTSMINFHWKLIGRNICRAFNCFLAERERVSVIFFSKGLGGANICGKWILKARKHTNTGDIYVSWWRKIRI